MGAEDRALARDLRGEDVADHAFFIGESPHPDVFGELLLVVLIAAPRDPEVPAARVARARTTESTVMPLAIRDKVTGSKWFVSSPQPAVSANMPGRICTSVTVS